jgi:hypothetical protein
VGEKILFMQRRIRRKRGKIYLAANRVESYWFVVAVVIDTHTHTKCVGEKPTKEPRPNQARDQSVKIEWRERVTNDDDDK